MLVGAVLIPTVRVANANTANATPFAIHEGIAAAT